MSNPRGIWLFVVSAAAAACWDGSLDPVIGLAGDDDGTGDSDSDSESESGSDTDTDSGSDTATEPASCSVAVSLEVWYWVSPWEWYQDECNFEYQGVCAAESEICAGCAWISGVEGDCGADEICCVGEDELEHCVTDWDLDFYCGYQVGECEDPPVYDEDVVEPVCQDGTFCCFTI